MPNLKNCPACQKEVSKDALTCPNCGQKLKDSFITKVVKIIVYLFLAYILFEVSFYVMAGYENAKKEISAEKKKAREEFNKMNSDPDYQKQKTFEDIQKRLNNK